MSKALLIVSPILLVWTLAGSLISSAGRPLTPPWMPTTPFSSETATVTIDGVRLDAEIADTEQLRTRGLSYRNELQPDTGMLFVYQSASTRSFWMYEMRFCLDIVWIAEGEVVGAAENACPAARPGDEIPRFRSPEPAQFVLEVGAGWMEEHRLGAGSLVEIDFPDSVDTVP